MPPKTFLSIFMICASLSALGQKYCATDNYKDKQLAKYQQLEGLVAPSNSDPAMKKKLASLTGIITIPLSIHVLYNTNTPAEKLDTSLIIAEVAEVNRDFSGTNEDRRMIPDSFKRYDAGDCGFRFVLAKLTIKPTKRTSFLEDRPRDTDNIQDDQIKFSKLGGDNGDCDQQYLNIWIGNIKNGSSKQILGYSTFPGGIDKYDGVVIYYKAIGPQPYPSAIRGRTLTHEIGHWLNLFHLWGDDDNHHCGDDLVSDTPVQSEANYNIPSFPHCTCGVKGNGDMYVDFMDYTIDTGMYMFTQGQKERMRLNFVEGGQRASFLHSNIYNDLTKIDTAKRGDLNTPVISYVRDLKANNKLIGKTVKWIQQADFKNYIVRSRILGSSKWDSLQTTNNTVQLSRLKLNQIYEVRVQTVSNSGDISTASQAYIFKNKPALTAKSSNY